MKLNIIKNITECEIAGRISKFQIPDVHCAIRPQVIVLLCKTAEMQCFSVSYALTSEHIERIVKYIGYIPVVESINELKDIVFDKNEIEILLFNVNMYKITLNTFAIVCKLIQ